MNECISIKLNHESIFYFFQYKTELDGFDQHFQATVHFPQTSASATSIIFHLKIFWECWEQKSGLLGEKQPLCYATLPNEYFLSSTKVMVAARIEPRTFQSCGRLVNHLITTMAECCSATNFADPWNSKYFQQFEIFMIHRFLYSRKNFISRMFLWHRFIQIYVKPNRLGFIKFNNSKQCKQK